MARLDAAIVQQGLVPSRQRAKTLIQNGQISVNGKVCTKPAFAVEETDQITMEGSDIPFVGRGGLKLEYALEQTKRSLDGLVCLDIGASTGGFTDCMLQRGAAKVYAIDVGHGQLVQSLRENPRVVNWEGTDVRSIAPEQLEQPADFFSVDVSFISLHHVLPYVLPLLKPDAAGAILIKPQFEAGRENIGKNGLVQSQRVHVQVLGNILTLLSALGLTVQLLCPNIPQYLYIWRQCRKAAKRHMCRTLRLWCSRRLHRRKRRRRNEGRVVSPSAKGQCPGSGEKGLPGTPSERYGGLGRPTLSGSAERYGFRVLCAFSGGDTGCGCGSCHRW